jgi:RNA polymerase sigma-70 factor (subfamily 1)
VCSGEHDTESLLRAARGGDVGAVDRMLATHRPTLVRMIAARLDAALERRVDASDVVQDALLVASKRIAEFLAEPRIPFALWLRRIARDRLAEQVRRHHAAGRRALAREQGIASGAFRDASSLDLLEQLVDPRRTPAASLIRRELLARFGDALARLDEDDQEIVLLRHGEQLSNHAVAELLGLSDAAAGMRYLRALRRLREALEASRA